MNIKIPFQRIECIEHIRSKMKWVKFSRFPKIFKDAIEELPSSAENVLWRTPDGEIG